MNKIMILILAFGLAACSSPVKNKESISEVIGTSLAAKKYSNIYFSAQPSSETYKPLKAEGFALIVNLRDPSEYNEAEEKKLVLASGMAYHNVPFSKSAKLSDTFIKSVTDVVVKHRKAGKILIHCSSGNRVGVWAGGHFFKDHGYSKAKSIQVAQKYGISKPDALSKLQSYLDSK